LRSGTTGALAVVIFVAPGEDRKGLNPFYLELLGSIGAAAAARGYDLLVSFQDISAELRGGFEAAGKADGTILIGSARNRTAWAFFQDARFAQDRIICWGAPDDKLPTVRCDNRAAARVAVDHLIARGRRRIALVAPGWQQQQSFAERRHGYLDALAAAGLSPVEGFAGDMLDREQQGYSAVQSLLRRDDDRPDGIFAASDMLAFGAMRAIRERGVMVPKEIAVVGFDGISSAAHTSPSLTTIDQDCESAGTALVNSLIDMVDGRDAPPRGVKMTLVCRESS
jgi:DNA-binding LacI/PurR family transcriptional regulator